VVQRYGPPFAALGVLALEPEDVGFQVHPVPGELQQLILPAAGVERQSNEVRQVRRLRFLFRFTNQHVRLGTAQPTQATLRLPERSEEHTSELQSRSDLVCRLLLEKKKKS